MTAATAAATGAMSFIAVRFLFGIGEAGAFPSATRAMQLWYPREERGLVQGLTHSASRLGAAIAPPIVVLIITTLSWRWVFYISGMIGIVWSVWWYFAYRNLPEEHGLVNRAELARIRGVGEDGEINEAHDRAQGGDRAVGHPDPLAQHVGDHVRLLHLCVLPLHLPDLAAVLSRRSPRHFTLLKVGIFASLPLFAGVIGDTVGGLATDWLLKKTGNTKLARRSVAIVGLLGCAVFIVPAALTEDAYVAVYLPDRGDVLPRMHDRPVVVGADGHRRQIFRDGVRHDEHGRKLRRRDVAPGVRLPRPSTATGRRRSSSPPCCSSLGAAVWAFWLDPDRSVVEKHDAPVAVPATAH